jgi:hypothetical protein
MIAEGKVAAWVSGKVLDVAWDQAKSHLMARRAGTARKILIEELERGDANPADVDDVDEAAAMVFEYANAAERGAARRNLRLLAQVLAGSIITKPIYADEFLRWSRILADLTREEILVLGLYLQGYERLPSKPQVNPQTIFIEIQKSL